MSKRMETITDIFKNMGVDFFAVRGSSKSRIRMVNILASMDKKDADIIKKIASEFPYGTDVVVDEYIKNDCSESKTRSALQERLVQGF